ncbi:DUF3822 family protein [Prolixibacteraceae bacterium Z1-6]|uniref:DUF3822 family protein n=1 Tax=Draconibacterium aestuarii TaxID=2998507 RepID=A0A9X3F3W3_9BACT|nr:DUF3822 family protein [Prolixibacteraceae bacterium Z1-6]
MPDFVAESFKIEDTFEYILSIQVSLNGFSFSVLRPVDNTILVFKSTTLKISSDKLIARRFSEWMNSEELLQKTYKKTRVIILSDKFTLIPKSLHRNNLNEELAHLLFKEGSKLQFAENLVEKINAKLLFTLPDGINKIISQTIGECEIMHPVKSIINNFPESNEKNTLVLLFNNNTLFLALGKNKQLLLANSFTINHSNDVVYYVLTALKQLEVPTLNTKLFYAGKSVYANDTHKNLQKYFASTSLFLPNKFEHESKLSEELIAENIALYI